MSERSNEGNVRIPGIHRQASDGMRVRKANELPGLTRVDRFVDTVAADDIAANTRLSSSDVNDIRVRLRNCDCTDGWRRIFLLVENRLPVEAAIRRLPYASGDGAKIVDIGLADYARHRDDAAATKWADQSILQTLPRALVLALIFVFVLVLLSVAGLRSRSLCLHSWRNQGFASVCVSARILS